MGRLHNVQHDRLRNLLAASPTEVQVDNIGIVSVPYISNRLVNVLYHKNGVPDQEILLFHVSILVPIVGTQNRDAFGYITDGGDRYWEYNDRAFRSCTPPPQAVRQAILQKLKEIMDDH
jgi:hypothetical protein